MVSYFLALETTSIICINLQFVHITLFIYKKNISIQSKNIIRSY